MDLLCPEDASLSIVPINCRGSIDFTVAFENYILILIPSAILVLLAPIRLQTIRSRSIKVISPTVLQAIKTFSALCFAGFSLASLIVSARLDTAWRSSEIAAATVSFFASLLCVALSGLEHFRSIRPSLLVQLYLLIASVVEAVHLRSVYLRAGDLSLTVVCCGKLASCVLFLMSESRAKEDILATKVKRSPQDVNELFSQRLFLWLNDLFVRGFRGILTPRDLYSIDEELASPEIQRRFRLMFLSQDARRHNMFFILLRSMPTYLLGPITPRLLWLGTNFAQPYLIKRLVEFVSAPHEAPPNEGPLLVVAGCLVYTFTAVFEGWYWQSQNRFDTKLRAVLTTAIHEKALRAKTDPEHSPLMLMNVDVEKAVNGLRPMHEFWAVVLTMGLSLALLKSQVGLSFIAPTLLMIIIVLFITQNGNSVGPAQKLWLTATQKRVTFITEMAASMKSVKLMGLVPLVHEMGNKLRENEVDALRDVRLSIFINLMISQFVFQLSALVMYGSFAIQTRLGGPTLTYSNLFSSMAFLRLFTTPLNGTIQYVPSFIQGLAGLSRIQKYLASEEHHDPRKESPSVGFAIKDATAGYDTTPDALHDLSVSLEPGAFHMVIGSVGSGKSTLLKTFAGETLIAKGEVLMHTLDLSFCDQLPWLWNGTIKENIIGETDFDERWFDQVVWACGLYEDFAEMSHGPDTKTGDDGTALSGGQKNRISLARGLYARKPLLVADDVLAGLDTRTEALVFGRVFGPKGILRKMTSTTLLATHSVGWLKYADSVIVLEAGTCAYQGPPLTMPARFAAVGPGTTVNENDDYTETVQKPPSVKGPAAEAVDFRRDKRTWLEYLKSFGLWPCIIYFTVCALPPVCSNMLSIVLQYLADTDTRDAGVLGKYYGIIVGIIALNIVLLTFEFWYLFMSMCPTSSIVLHAKQLKALVQVSFPTWGAVETGNIANRFSQDITMVDANLPGAFTNLSNYIYMITVSIGIILVAAPYTAAALPFVGGMLFLIQKIYLKTSKQLKIMDLEAKAPLCSHFLQTVSGITTVRAYGWAEKNREKNLALLEASQAPFYLLLSIEQWLDLVLGLVVAGFSTVLLAVVVAVAEKLNAGLLGVSLINLMSLGSLLAMMVQMWTMFDTSLGAVARIKHFCASMPQEEQGSVRPANDWLSNGRVEIKALEASYSTTADPILKDVTVSIPPGHKVAICGRTGSGKSSLASALFGLLHVRSGSILIDGADITKVSQDELRTRMIALPQDPFFISGTVRTNLALRFYERDNVSDASMLTALEKVGLRGKFEALAAASAEWATPLDVELNPADMLTRGQQQLFAMARTMLARGQVVVVDEATSGLDHASDDLVQKLIRSELKGKTIVAIAHRLKTIMDFDTVVVMNAGRVVEVGNPMELAGKQGGWFWGLVKGGGEKDETKDDKKGQAEVRVHEVSS